MKLHFRKIGEGPALIIIHGLFGMLDNWMTIARKLSETYTVYLVDQRNHGKSPHSDEFDYYLMAEDLEEMMDEWNLEEVHILGHSMGGKTAMQFAVRNAASVKSLTVVDIAPKDYPRGHDEIFEAFESVDLAALESRKQAEAQMSEVLDDRSVQLFLLKNLDRSGDQYKWKPNIPVIKEQYDNIIVNSLSPWESYDGPTLFIKGARSERYVEEEDLPTIEGFFPAYELTVLDAGHWVHAEKPKELLETVEKFLGKAESENA